MLTMISINTNNFANHSERYMRLIYVIIKVLWALALQYSYLHYKNRLWLYNGGKGATSTPRYGHKFFVGTMSSFIQTATCQFTGSRMYNLGTDDLPHFRAAQHLCVS